MPLPGVYGRRSRQGAHARTPEGQAAAARLASVGFPASAQPDSPPRAGATPSRPPPPPPPPTTARSFMHPRTLWSDVLARMTFTGSGPVNVAMGRPSLSSSRLMSRVTRRSVARRSAALTFGSKIVKSVAEWVSSRHLRRPDHSRLAYQSSGSGAGAGSARSLGPMTASTFFVQRRISGIARPGSRLRSMMSSPAWACRAGRVTRCQRCLRGVERLVSADEWRRRGRLRGPAGGSQWTRQRFLPR